MTTIDQRIARTGYVVCYPAIESLGEAEHWFACDANGIIATRGATGFNAVQCREMVERGALVEHVALLAGVVIYKQVRP